MSVTVQKGTKMYCPNPEQFPESRYVVFLDIDERWRWLWEERDEPDEIGPSFATRAEALASIADDWEASGGTDRPRFVGMLRGLAKREAARSESEYTPTLDELLSAYINKRAMTFTAFEIDRAIERVRAEQREKDAQIEHDAAVWDEAIEAARTVIGRRKGTYEADIDLLTLPNPYREESC